MRIKTDIQISLRKNTGESNEKSLFERSEFMIFQMKEVFLRVEKFELKYSIIKVKKKEVYALEKNSKIKNK